MEQHDNIDLKLNWDMLVFRDNKIQEDFLYYHADQLIGFLGLYRFGSKVEVCGMVHPDYRRKGIFTELFKACLLSLEGARCVLLNTPGGSETGEAWLKTVSSTYEESEYLMRWSGEKVPELEETVCLRRSLPGDIELKKQLDIVCFGFKPEEAKEYNDRLEQDGYQEEFFMIEADGKTVGKIRVHRDQQRSEIYGFAILPEFQGKGYGRKALQQAVRMEVSRGQSVYLDVQIENKHALSLYTASGFCKENRQDYYRYPIKRPLE
ncbi:Acetyltransferase (GNAT) family protein [Terribacillus aidingensis]|uniref:Acetyltransferase (GNAT) family protein n=1 Tax=Terribacillus aidingensis TaxID=586416 RepID=A0A285P6G5_9BACI|nr:GNAT family N-acetyltransferase [Terribacillus aidingensis]SNZ17325.1 Acetyltransferase (GNAT) family protein [Terribacillus aidingensis]